MMQHPAMSLEEELEENKNSHLSSCEKCLLGRRKLFYLNFLLFFILAILFLSIFVQTLITMGSPLKENLKGIWLIISTLLAGAAVLLAGIGIFGFIGWLWTNVILLIGKYIVIALWIGAGLFVLVVLYNRFTDSDED